LLISKLMELALTLLKTTEFSEYLSFDDQQLLITVYLSVIEDFKDDCCRAAAMGGDGGGGHII
jgi:hypothetical protein